MFIIPLAELSVGLSSGRYQNSSSTFAKHRPDTGHLFGPMEQIMDTLHCVKKKRGGRGNL